MQLFDSAASFELDPGNTVYLRSQSLFEDTAPSDFQLPVPSLDDPSNDVLSSTSDLFVDDDITSSFLPGQDNEPALTLTDATLQSSSCLTQRTLSGDGEHLLSRDGKPSCPSPAAPLSPGTLQLFQDPTNSLENLLLDDSESNPLPPLPYPGRLTPEEEKVRKNYPGIDWGETGPIDGEEWRLVIPEGKHPCQPYLELGYSQPLCCDGGVKLTTDLALIRAIWMKYLWVDNCD